MVEFLIKANNGGISPDKKMDEFSKTLRFAEIIGSRIGSPFVPGSRIFDLGSGGGSLVKLARELGYDGCGADFYDNDVSPYLKKIDGEGPYQIPYPDENFDIALSTGVFEHVQDYDSTLAELHRILKPGGVEPEHVSTPVCSDRKPRFCAGRHYFPKLWLFVGVVMVFKAKSKMAE